jgi:hypothetical protein
VIFAVQTPWRSSPVRSPELQHPALVAGRAQCDSDQETDNELRGQE